MEQSYKEKYEQAIERLKQWDREHPCAGYVLSDRDKFIFPELAESEDEKIKKCIFKALSKRDARDVLISQGIKVSDALAWLEKQGDYANFRDKAQVGDRITKNEDGVLVNLSQLKRVAKPADSYCQDCTNRKGCMNCENGELRETEQKPVEENKGNIGGISPNWSEEEERYICQLESMVKERWASAEKAQDEEVIKNMSNLAFFLKTLNPNNKPAWSEEDSFRTETLISVIKSGGSIRPELRNEFVNWLKSLKGRVKPQPKQEWSEEDKDFMYDTLSNLTELKDRYGEEYGKVGDCINWLKSLKPQPKQSFDEDTQQWIDTIIKDYEDLYNTDKDHRATIQAKISILKSLRPQNRWKPSDEQVDALTETVHNLWGSPETTLSGLLADLKKLKEE